ncbi:MAG: ABC transporter permease subunit [Ruminococcus sp.]|nr:ABC transporter permease subunit [Ruminococcus sp.]
MINMAKADLYRLVRSKGTYICLLVMAVLYAGALIADSIAMISAGYDPSRYFNSSFKTDLRMVGCNANYYFLMLFPVSVLLLSDFSSRTLKNTLSSVTTKTKYYVFKFIAVQCVSICYFLLGNSGYYAARRLMYGSGRSTPAGEYFAVVFWQLPTFIAIISVFIMLAFIIRKTAVFNTIIILVPSVYTVAVGVFLEIKTTSSFAEKYLVDYDFTNIYQYIAASRSTGFHISVATASIAIAAAAFAFGLRHFKRSETLK